MQVAARAGDDPRALKLAEQVLQAHRQAWGHNDPGLLVILCDLTLAYYANGRILDADRTIREAERLVAGTELRAIDAYVLARNVAVVDYEMGRWETARQGYARLLAQADNTESQLRARRGLARALTAQGRYAQARDAAQQAVDEAQQTEQDWDEAAGQLELAAAAIGLRQPAAARTALAVAQARMDAMQVVPTSYLRRRAERLALLAELSVGERDRAQAVAGPVRAAAHQGPNVGDDQRMQMAYDFDALGLLARQGGQPGEAAEAHGQAAALWQRLLPAGHPLALRNRALAALAAAEASDSPAAPSAARPWRASWPCCRPTPPSAPKCLLPMRPARPGMGSYWGCTECPPTCRCASGPPRGSRQLGSGPSFSWEHPQARNGSPSRGEPRHE